jgi:hypothetical protein
VHSARLHFGPRPSVWPGPAAQATRLAQPVQCVRCARPRGHRARRGHGGAVGPGSPVDEVGRGKRREHRCGTGDPPEKVRWSGGLERRLDGVSWWRWAPVGEGTCSTGGVRER